MVAEFYSSMEAELSAARLRSEGINCFLANNTLPSVMPYLETVIRLHVRPVDSAKAREILHEAAIESAETNKSPKSGYDPIRTLAIIIGGLLVSLLVKALSL